MRKNLLLGVSDLSLFKPRRQVVKEARREATEQVFEKIGSALELAFTLAAIIVTLLGCVIIIRLAELGMGVQS